MSSMFLGAAGSKSSTPNQCTNLRSVVYLLFISLLFLNILKSCCIGQFFKAILLFFENNLCFECQILKLPASFVIHFFNFSMYMLHKTCNNNNSNNILY